MAAFVCVIIPGVSPTVLDAPVPKYSISSKCSTSALIQCRKCLNKLENAFRYASLGNVFSSEITALARSWTREHFPPSYSLPFKEPTRQGGYGKTSIFFSLKILAYRPCFVGTGIAVEEDALGGGDWVLTARNDFGQNCFCIP